MGYGFWIVSINKISLICCVFRFCFVFCWFYSFMFMMKFMLSVKWSDDTYLPLKRFKWSFLFHFYFIYYGMVFSLYPSHFHTFSLFLFYFQSFPDLQKLAVKTMPLSNFFPSYSAFTFTFITRGCHFQHKVSCILKFPYLCVVMMF